MKDVTEAATIFAQCTTPVEVEEWLDPKFTTSGTVSLLPVPALTRDMCSVAHLFDFVEDEAQRMSVSTSIIFMALLAVLGSVIGRSICIRPKAKDKWTVAPNNWMVGINWPGQIKTGSLAVPLNFLYELQRKADGEYELSMRKFEVERESYETQVLALKDRHREKVKKDPETPQSELSNAIEALKKPIPPPRRMYFIHDATWPATKEALSDNPNGLLQISDEVIGWFKEYERPENGQAYGEILTSHEGIHKTSYTRIGRGIKVDISLSLSVVGCAVIDTIKTYVIAAISGGKDDGFFQRLQYAVFPDPVPFVYVDRAPNDTLVEKIRDLFNTLAHSDFVTHGAQQDSPDGIPYLRFSEDAQALFECWYTELRGKRAIDPHESAVMREHLSKYAKLMPSIALIFHLVEWASGDVTALGPVTIRAVEAAIKLCAFLESHARRIYGLANDMEACDELADHILAGDLKDGFTAHDVYHKKGWSGLKTRKAAEVAIARLVERHWLREEKGGKAPKYFINPKLMIKKGETK